MQTTLDGRITFANHFCHQVLGDTDGALVGASMFDRIHQDDRAYFQESGGSILIVCTGTTGRKDTG